MAQLWSFRSTSGRRPRIQVVSVSCNTTEASRKQNDHRRNEQIEELQLQLESQMAILRIFFFLPDCGTTAIVSWRHQNEGLEFAAVGPDLEHLSIGNVSVILQSQYFERSHFICNIKSSAYSIPHMCQTFAVRSTILQIFPFHKLRFESVRWTTTKI